MKQICAVIHEVNCCSLEVTERETGEEILVHTHHARCFSRGDTVRICYCDGQTEPECECTCHCRNDLYPAEITATCIQRVCC